MLAEEIVFLRRGQAGVAVGRTHKPELVGIGTEPLFQGKTDFERFTGILAGQHIVSLGFAQIQITGVPGFVIGESVVG